ncbi:hypothetical protein [Nonomuraea sp. NPDC049758]|uniref:hypothetical protein n=1 Tax=Nonomuraea sp. NPDC049758 TaxID=3154360 RepID=UPI00341C30BC
MRKQTLPALALAAAAALSACDGPSGGATARQAGPKQAHALGSEAKGSLDVSLLRVVEADFDPYGTPEELAADRPVVAAGTIDGWQQGPVLKTYPGGPLDHRVVLRMRVKEALKGVKGRKTIPDGLVYIELSQGGVVSDPKVPVEQWKPRRSVADLKKRFRSAPRCSRSRASVLVRNWRCTTRGTSSAGCRADARASAGADIRRFASWSVGDPEVRLW